MNVATITLNGDFQVEAVDGKLQVVPVPVDRQVVINQIEAIRAQQVELDERVKALQALLEATE